MCGQWLQLLLLLDVGSSMQLKDEKTTSEMEEKSNIPESTSTSQYRNKNKFSGGKQREPIADSQTEGTNAKKSKLASDSTLFDINVVSESEQPHSTNKSLRRRRKPLISKVNIGLKVDWHQILSPSFSLSYSIWLKCMVCLTNDLFLFDLQISNVEAIIDSTVNEPSNSEVYSRHVY